MISGIDVSRWQPPDLLDYQLIKDAGYKFAAVRCTIGDYYTDSKFSEHWENFGNIEFFRMPYLVVAPADSYGRKISAAEHMQRFLGAFGDRESELPWVLDCELTRGQSKAYITDLTAGVVEECNSHLGRYPIIYTRESWWDAIVYQDPLWSKCPLWAARYNPGLKSPWSDGLYKFRDWQTWHFWQWTSHGRIPGYMGDVDLDHFNGSIEDLNLFACNLNQKTMLKILWREAEKAGWNLTP